MAMNRIILSQRQLNTSLFLISENRKYPKYPNSGRIIKRNMVYTICFSNIGFLFLLSPQPTPL